MSDEESINGMGEELIAEMEGRPYVKTIDDTYTLAESIRPQIEVLLKMAVSYAASTPPAYREYVVGILRTITPLLNFVGKFENNAENRRIANILIGVFGLMVQDPFALDHIQSKILERTEVILSLRECSKTDTIDRLRKDGLDASDYCEKKGLLLKEIAEELLKGTQNKR